MTSVKEVPHIVVCRKHLQLQRQHTNCLPEHGHVIPAALYNRSAHARRGYRSSAHGVKAVQGSDKLCHIDTCWIQDLHEYRGQSFVNSIYRVVLQSLVDL